MQSLQRPFGIILFILIFPLTWLSGVSVFADGGENDDEPPKPVTSFEMTDTTSEQYRQTAIPAVKSVEASAPAEPFEPKYFIFLSAVQGSPPAAGGPVTFMNDLELAVLDLVNEERAKAGCGPVAGEPHLKEAAYLHSKDMADNGYFSHKGQNGSRFWHRAADAGYEGFAAAENIAAGQTTAESVMQTWMNSSGHRRNILNCSHDHVGIGYYKREGSRYRHYWTQLFGRE